jgi:hypothetical protein
VALFVGAFSAPLAARIATVALATIGIGSMTDHVDLVTAAAMLQPHLGDLNATNWLADMRRKRPCYRPRVLTPPAWCKREGTIKYPKYEILRVAREIEILKRAPGLLPLSR